MYLLMKMQNHTQTGIPAPEKSPGSSSGAEAGSWRVTQDVGVAPRSITVRFKHYKLAYCVGYDKKGVFLFGPATLYCNGREIAKLSSFDEIRKELQKRNLPLKGIPHITPQ
jgi:hypothetical protein